SYDVGGASFIVVADFNGDRRADIAAAVGRSIVVLLGEGQGKFGKPSSFAVGGEPVALAAGDFNGDGRADIATVNPAKLNISVLLGDGRGAFGKSSEYPCEKNARSIVAADFDGDGHVDLIGRAHV